MTTRKDDQTMQEVYDRFFRIMNVQIVDEQIHPHVIAAILVKIAFEIYRTSLNDEQYNAIIDKISADRHLIKSLVEQMQDHYQLKNAKETVN